MSTSKAIVMTKKLDELKKKFNKYDWDTLIGIYKDAMYLYMTEDEFAKCLQMNWYKFFDVFEKECTKEFIHPYKNGQIEKDVKDFYREMNIAMPCHTVVGTPCTVYLYSDRYGATVVDVKYYKNRKDVVGLFNIPKEITIRRNKYHYEDHEGNCVVDPENMMRGEEVFTRRSNGKFYAPGRPMKQGEVYVRLGFRYTYIDPSF